MEKKTEFYMTAGIAADMDSDISFASEISSIIHQFINKVKAVEHPLYHILHDEPNPEMSSFVFRETLMTHLLLWGNAYAQIIRNGKGEVISLYPLILSVDHQNYKRKSIKLHCRKARR